MKCTGRMPLNFATWNVRRLLQTGKLHIVEKELHRYKISIARISETTNGNKILLSGNDNGSRNEVAFVLSTDVCKFLLVFNTVSDRTTTIKLQRKPIPINIIQIYAPTSTSTDEIEEFYGRRNTLENPKQRNNYNLR